jgi:RNA polymerase sigma-70 factor, ECF subfamily
MLPHLLASADGPGPLFIASLSARRRAALAAAERVILAAALEKAVAAAKAAWPALELDDRVFAVHLAVRAGGWLTPGRALAQMRLGDLYLACACLERVPGAAAALDRATRPVISQYLARLEADTETEAEAIQTLFARLFAPVSHRSSALIGYQGRSTLGKWLGVGAQRIVLNARRAEDARRRLVARLAREPVPSCLEPEESLFRQQHENVLANTLREALATLPARDRAMVNMYLVDRVSTVQIARTYHVDHSTVSRRLARSYAAVRSRVKKRLHARLHLCADEVESLVQGLKVDLDLDLDLSDHGCRLGSGAQESDRCVPTSSALFLHRSARRRSEG